MPSFVLPLDVLTEVFDGLPSGLGGSIGQQITRASTGSTVLGRTSSGITERPPGSGSYVAQPTAAAEQGVYLLTVDWNGGVLEPATSRTHQFEVTTTLPVVITGLGAIADEARSHLGGIFDKLVNSPSYGSAHVVGRIEVVKERLMTAPPDTTGEATLPRLVKDYLGKLAALELIPAVFALLQGELQQESTANDPLEIVSYVDKIKVVELVRDELLAQTRRDESTVLPLLDQPNLRAAADGPAVDEVDEFRVMADPRDVPPFSTFPHRPFTRVPSRPAR